MFDRLEPPDRRVVGVCAACGEDIIAGSLVRRDGEYLLHNDQICLRYWAEHNFSILSVFDGMGIPAEVA